MADKWNVDKGVRGFTTWELTNTLISCFFLHLGSYRDVESTHGIPDSTFGDAIRKYIVESQKKNVNLRHVIYRDPLTQKIFHFVCSDFKISTRAIADIYKKRWAVELLFRWLKGHLDIRRLPTKTINAARTMLATAVLFQLLLQLKKITDKFKGTLWDLLRSIRSALVKKCLADCEL